MKTNYSYFKILLLSLVGFAIMSCFLPWFSFLSQDVTGNDLEGIGVVNCCICLGLLPFILIGGLKNPIKNNYQLILSTASGILIIYNFYNLKQLETNNTIFTKLNELLDKIPFIDLHSFLDVNYEYGLYLFFISLILILISPVLNHFYNSIK
jgi:hypothetical protein